MQGLGLDVPLRPDYEFQSEGRYHYFIICGIIAFRLWSGNSVHHFSDSFTVGY